MSCVGEGMFVCMSVCASVFISRCLYVSLSISVHLCLSMCLSYLFLAPSFCLPSVSNPPYHLIPVLTTLIVFVLLLITQE